MSTSVEILSRTSFGVAEHDSSCDLCRRAGGWVANASEGATELGPVNDTDVGRSASSWPPVLEGNGHLDEPGSLDMANQRLGEG